MDRLYLIPNLNELDDLAQLRKQYQANWEYNEFFIPNTLDDKKKVMSIIDTYAKVVDSFKKDTIHGAFLDVTVHSNDRMIREASEFRVRQSLDIAKEMGVRGVVFHTGRLYNFREAKYTQNWLDVNETFFRKMLDEYQDVEIYMENMFDEASDILAQLAQRMADADRFGICLDYAHCRVYGQDDRTWFKNLAPYVKHMHINDNDGQNDLHQPVGEGTINWAWFNALMETNNVDATILVEVSGYEKQRKSLEFMERNSVLPFTI